MFKFRLTAYISVQAFHLLGNTSLLLGTYLTLSNVMQITSTLIMDLLLVPNFIIALVSYTVAGQLQCAWTKELELVFTCTLNFFIWKKVNYLEDIHFREIIFCVKLLSRKQIVPYFFILRRFISKNVCSVIIAGKRSMFATLPKMY